MLQVIKDSDGKETQSRPVSETNPLQVNVRGISNQLEKYRVASESDDPILDVLERIAQMIGMVNNGNYLAPGERFY